MNSFENVDSGLLLLVEGETFSFYNNSEMLSDSLTFDDWHLDLYFAIGSNGVGEKAVSDIGQLEKDVISGTNFRWWSSFEVPAGLTPGVCYYLIVTDSSNYDEVIYISDKIKAVSENSQSFNDSEYYLYRNSVNIENYNYEGLPDFNNQFRVPTVRRAPSYPTNRNGYDISSGAFLPVRTTKGKEYEFVTQWLDDERHEGFSSATIHNQLRIKEEGQFVFYERGDDTEYAIEWTERFTTAEGVIRLQRKASYNSNKAQ